MTAALGVVIADKSIIHRYLKIHKYLSINKCPWKISRMVVALGVVIAGKSIIQRYLSKYIINKASIDISGRSQQCWWLSKYM